MGFCRGVYGMFYRNAVAKLRNPASTLVELCVPCIFLFLCLVIRLTGSIRTRDTQVYTDPSFSKCLNANYDEVRVSWGTYQLGTNHTCQNYDDAFNNITQAISSRINDSDGLQMINDSLREFNYFPLFTLRQWDLYNKPALLADQIAGRELVLTSRGGIPLLVAPTSTQTTPPSGLVSPKLQSDPLPTAESLDEFLNRFLAAVAPKSFGLYPRCNHLEFNESCSSQMEQTYFKNYNDYPPEVEATTDNDSRITTHRDDAPPIVAVLYDYNRTSNELQYVIRCFSTEVPLLSSFTAPISPSLQNLFDQRSIIYRVSMPIRVAGNDPHGAQLHGFLDTITLLLMFLRAQYGENSAGGGDDSTPLTADQSAAVRHFIGTWRTDPVGPAQAMSSIQAAYNNSARFPVSMAEMLSASCAICHKGIAFEGFGTPEESLCNTTNDLITLFANDTGKASEIWESFLNNISAIPNEEYWVNMCNSSQIATHLLPFLANMSVDNFVGPAGNVLAYNVTLPNRFEEMAFQVPLFQAQKDYMNAILARASASFISPMNQSATVTTITESAMPVPEETLSSTVDQLLIFGMWGMVWFAVFLFPLAKAVKAFMLDKSMNIREVLNIYGCSNLQYWTSWYLFFFLYGIIVSLLVAVFSYGIYPGINAMAPFMLSLCFFMAGTSFMLLMSSILSNPRTAPFVSMVLFFALVIPYLAVFQLKANQYVWKMVSMIAAPTALSWGCDSLMARSFESIGTSLNGFMYSDWKVPFRGIRFWEILVMLLADTVGYSLVGVYIYSIRPGEYGVPLKPWFFLLPSYWFPQRKIAKLKDRMARRLTLKDSETRAEMLFEDDYRLDEEAIINVNNVHKIYEIPGYIILSYLSMLFGWCRKSKENGQIKAYEIGVHAVKGVTFNVYEGEILCLLGHNGAGKTTTISLLTGLLPISYGSASIEGFDVSENTSSARRCMGFCPQFNLLFTDLTIREHFKIIGLIKNMTCKQIDEETSSLLDQLELTEKSNTQAADLSGGQQRRVTLGMALMGNTRAVFLDEPSTGLDPSTRRALWNTLKKIKSTRAMILTTHFMDEADYLGDRVGIMADGTLRCMGTPMFLKSRLGVGYTLTCTKKTSRSPDDDRKLVEEVCRCCKGSKLRSDIGLEVAFKIPFDASGGLTSLIEQFEGQQLGVDSFSISITTLEEVFLKIAYYEDTKEPPQEEPAEAAEAALEKQPLLSFIESRKWASRLDVLVDPHEQQVSPGNATTTRRRTGDSVTFKNAMSQKSSMGDQLLLTDQDSIQNVVQEPSHEATPLEEQSLYLESDASHSNREVQGDPISAPATPTSSAVQPPPASSASRAEPTLSKDDSQSRPASAGAASTSIEIQPVASESIGPPQTLEPGKPPRSTFLDTTSWGVMKALRFAGGGIGFGEPTPKSQQQAESPEAGATPEQRADSDEAVFSVEEVQAKTVLKVKAPGGQRDIFAESMQHVLRDTCWNRARRHSRALMLKQFHCLRRDGMSLLCQIVFPVSVICVLAAIMNTLIAAHSAGVEISFDNVPSSMPSDNYMPQTIRIGGPEAATLETILNSCSVTKNSDIPVVLYVDPAPTLEEWNQHMLDYADKWAIPHIVAYFAETDTNNPGKLNVTAYHNSSVYSDALLLSLTTLVKCDLEYTLPAAPKLTIVNSPLPREEQWRELLRNTAIVLWIGFAVSLISATWGGQISKEAQVGAKESQYLAGVSVFGYWFSTYVFDFCLFVISGSLIIIALWGFHSSVLNEKYLGLFFSGFVGYGLASGPFTYILCIVLPNKPVLIQIVVTFVGCVSSALIPLLRSIDSYYVWKYFIYLLPTAALSELMCILGLDSPGPHGVTDNNGLWCVVFMYCEAVAYFLLSLALDSQFFSRGCSKLQPCAAENYKYPPYLTEEDSDVKRERERIQNIDKGMSYSMEGDVDPLLLIRGLNKTFQPKSNRIFGCKCGNEQPEKVAVRNLWFSVQHGQCFGFLGGNGAGKTTTVSMLVTAVIPTAGTAVLDGVDLVQQPREIRRLVGFCPQFDTLLDKMTSKEHLEMYGRIALIEEKYLRQEFVPEALSLLGLTEYANRVAGAYSGGNKRKLSIGIAFVGDPKLVILDEPSAGVDPASRRKLWSLISYTMSVSSRALVLTTHSMEECEALCSRLGIMKRGEMVCIGTPSQLKGKFGEGYEVHVTFVVPEQQRSVAPRVEGRHTRLGGAILRLRNRRTARREAESRRASMEGPIEGGGSVSTIMMEEDPTSALMFNRMDAFIEELAITFPGSQIVEVVGAHCRVNVPKTADSKLSQLFAKIESLKETYNLSSYAVSEASLDAIFVRLSKDTAPEELAPPPATHASPSAARETPAEQRVSQSPSASSPLMAAASGAPVGDV